MSEIDLFRGEPPLHADDPESGAVHVLTEPRQLPVGPPIDHNPLAKTHEHRTEVDLETGKIQTVIIDPNSGVATPVTLGVPPAMEAMLAAEAATAIKVHPTLRYVWDEGSQSIQTVFTDPATGTVLHKLPDDETLRMNATMREWAEDGLLDKSA